MLTSEQTLLLSMFDCITWLLYQLYLLKEFRRNRRKAGRKPLKKSSTLALSTNVHILFNDDD